jgi:hypothetical protein
MRGSRSHAARLGPNVQEQSVLECEAHQHGITGTIVPRSRAGRPGNTLRPREIDLGT